MDENALRRDIQVAKAAYEVAWGDTSFSNGYFPAETCFSERMIPVLAEMGVEWVIVADVHISRACADYPYDANQDNCDPPNTADQVNPAQGYYETISISRGVTVKIPPPFGYRPHYAPVCGPGHGRRAVSIIVVPAANADELERGLWHLWHRRDRRYRRLQRPGPPMLILFAHDGDNAWSGGYSLLQ